ncbi:MAG: uracil-DNA glycosylase [Parvularculaceae bacterium]|nr:uracil-DNA glycosylase [Parvularculaceae bacterium]
MTRAPVARQQPVARGVDAEPPKNCPLCSRLVAYRSANEVAYPAYFNGPAASFGSDDARLLIVGLAPGLHGANRTGRPFTGDYAGDLLYRTLTKFGFAAGVYGARADDGLTLTDAMITNAVRCAPPGNKPTPEEIRTCRPHLAARIESLKSLQAIVCLGRIAHESTVAALGIPSRLAAFAHGAAHAAPGGKVLFDSYHCSRYNTNTGRLTELMFERVFEAVRRRLDAAK